MLLYRVSTMLRDSVAAWKGSCQAEDDAREAAYADAFTAAERAMQELLVRCSVVPCVQMSPYLQAANLTVSLDSKSMGVGSCHRKGICATAAVYMLPASHSAAYEL